LGSAADVAPTLTVAGDGTRRGAVRRRSGSRARRSLPPVTPFTFQTTDVFAVPVTVAELAPA
jgi:hypothetical protein